MHERIITTHQRRSYVAPTVQVVINCGERDDIFLADDNIGLLCPPVGSSYNRLLGYEKCAPTRNMRPRLHCTVGLRP